MLGKPEELSDKSISPKSAIQKLPHHAVPGEQAAPSAHCLPKPRLSGNSAFASWWWMTNLQFAKR